MPPPVAATHAMLLLFTNVDITIRRLIAFAPPSFHTLFRRLFAAALLCRRRLLR